jgi:hypothetical protein
LKKLSLLGLTLVLLAARAASANVLWRGDFETGDISQWSTSEKVADDRLQVVADPVRQGKFALKATVHQGDDPINASGNRNELTFTKDNLENAERYYSWSTMWPADYASEKTWQVFTQWHHERGGGSPPVEFYVNGETVFFRVSGVVLWTTPLVRGQWHDFVLHVNWAANGSAELWYDGQHVLAPTPAHTLFPGQGGYLKQGLYRNASVGPVQAIFHDGMTVGTTLADVLPAAGATGSSGAPMFVEQKDGSLVDVTKAQGGCDTLGLGAMLPAALAAALMLGNRRRRARALEGSDAVR